MKDTTIAAISTAYGEAGIGIIRISGEDALSIAKSVFISPKKKDSFSFKNRYMHFGYIADGEKILDEALCVYMKAPHTYTGEDVVEIQCHGSLVSVKSILDLVIRKGAVPAEPGEFTKRAFLNGRLDLSQAEAVMDVIKAKTTKSFDAAMSQMQGSISSVVKNLRKNLLEELIGLTVNMDYPDEDIEEVTYDNLKNALSPIYNELCKLKDGAHEGRILREGLSIAIVGKPNVGKSSLLNVFLKENRSIVTDIPGTTRDTVEENASLRGIPVRFTDTAGIRESDDVVESLGIERSKEAFNRADLLLLLLDSSRPLEKEDTDLLDMAKGRNCILVLNKEDKENLISEEEIRKYYKGIIVRTSFVSGSGVEELKDQIEGFVSSGSMQKTSDSILTNSRHISLIQKAIEELEQAISEIEMGSALDFIEINVRAAFDYLGEITGDTASDEVINEVFARFCLGK